MKLKSYDKKIFIPNIFLNTLKVNKCQQVYLSLKKEREQYNYTMNTRKLPPYYPYFTFSFSNQADLLNFE